MAYFYAFRGIPRSRSLSNYTSKKLTQFVHPYVQRSLRAHVIFSKLGRQNIAACHLSTGIGGLNFTVRETSDDMYDAVDSLVSQINERLLKSQIMRGKQRSRVSQMQLF